MVIVVFFVFVIIVFVYYVEKLVGVREEKRMNVFLINVLSDFGLVIMDEGKDVVVKFDIVRV